MENCLPRRLLNPCGLSPFAMLLPPTCGVPEGIEVHQIDPMLTAGLQLVIHTLAYLQAPGKTHLMMKMQSIYQKTARIYTRN